MPISVNHEVLWAVIGFLVLAFLFVAHALLSAWASFKMRPRQPLVYCHVHGFFKPEHALPLPGTKATMCPVCFYTSLREAKK